ncbi:MAG TPA: hypothetical protein VNI83_06045 [Vicinamibacterales bacterium]|nr:hypothetical protein [Vicinamibacterales bacterium]
MSTSWDHTLRRLTERERAEARPKPLCVRPILHRCSGSRSCRNEPTIEWTYSYVTRGRGRVSSRRIRLCETHARGIAARYQVTMPTEPEEALDHLWRRVMERRATEAQG